MKDVIFHLEWRQTNIPRPILQDSTIRLLGSGILYIHGRAMDLAPILILDLINLGDLLDKK